MNKSHSVCNKQYGTEDLYSLHFFFMCLSLWYLKILLGNNTKKFLFALNLYFLDWLQEIVHLVYRFWLGFVSTCVVWKCNIESKLGSSMCCLQWTGTWPVWFPTALNFIVISLLLWGICYSLLWDFLLEDSFNCKLENSSQEKSPWRF